MIEIKSNKGCRMIQRLLIYCFISLLFLIPSVSFSGDFFVLGDGNFSIAETDTTNFQLFSFYDLRDRESFVQVTNTGSAATLHVQVFDVSNLCNENNFNDTYTPNDTHMYNMRDIQTNNGNDSGVVLPDNAYGFVVITVVQGIGQPTDESGVIIGNFRVLDNAGYEYRANSQGFKEGDPIGGQYHINYTTAGGITRSDIVGITVNNLLSGEVTTAGSSVTFDTNIYNLNEVPFSCSDTTFSCTENTFEYGINNAIPHSRDKAVLCGSNNVPEGFVKLEVINDRLSTTEAFAGFAGINTGNNSRGSMDSLIAVRTIICGDSILDGGEGETCDPPGELEPNGNECRLDCTFCGDGIVDEGQGETCDPPGDPQPPNDNDCRDDCTFCGDGIVDTDDGEECDDGNNDDADECSNLCELQGGCCLNEEVPFMCVEDFRTELDCTTVDSGTYLGDGTMCDTATNCQTVGVCCSLDNPCQEVTEFECEAIGGEYSGDGTMCEPSSCPQPMGACCNTNVCSITTADGCETIGGEYQGDDTVCEPGTCPFPPGNGDCCELSGNGTPGCENMTCQDEICFDDSICCALVWDEVCADAANIECGICGGGDDDDDDDDDDNVT